MYGRRESARLSPFRLEKRMRPRWHAIRGYFVTGLLVLVPAWGTVLILRTLFVALDELLAGLPGEAVKSDIPGLGLLSLLALIVLAGILATHLRLGQRILKGGEQWLERIPLVRSVYLTIKSMADLFQFRARFDRSTVVVFPFPREGLWALGFVMGAAPPAVQVARAPLMMVFVPTAIHPFTGYLAFIPKHSVVPINLPPEEAMKIEFSAGLYRPPAGWLSAADPSARPRDG
jgi:uncharacterized membrane protein